MFHPAILSILFLFAWREAEKDLAKGPSEFPADVVTGDRFRAAYVGLVAETMLYGALLAVAALLSDSFDTRGLPALQAALFLAGLVLCGPLIRRATEVADLFCQMDRAGRGEGRAFRDYFPSLVLMPLLPVAMGIFY